MSYLEFYSVNFFVWIIVDFEGWVGGVESKAFRRWVIEVGLGYFYGILFVRVMYYYFFWYFRIFIKLLILKFYFKDIVLD